MGYEYNRCDDQATIPSTNQSMDAGKERCKLRVKGVIDTSVKVQRRGL